MKTVILKHKFHNEKITYWNVKKVFTFNGIIEVTFDDKDYLRVVKDIEFYDMEIKEEE